MKPNCRGGRDVDRLGLGFISILHIYDWAIQLCSPARQQGEIRSPTAPLLSSYGLK